MYYNMISKRNKEEIKRENILKYKEEIIKIVDKMLEKDSHLSYEYYDLFKDPFFAFSKEIIDTFTILHSPAISSYVTSEINPIDKQILLTPKQKSVIEIMKKI
uniref:Uncharacterized protein n=1 Tax=viral metagenome TaxID=1070528 RepID=A0A6C0JQ77_9ZZZZ